MTGRLENKVAVITGSNSGIGLATAIEFAVQGAQVVLLARSQEKLDKAISEIGHNATGYLGDVWQMFADNLPARRVGNLSEMAKTALFLASDDYSFMFGSDLQADGGMNQVRWPTQ